MQASEAIDRLYRDLEQLRIDYERFFAGATPIPPEVERERIKSRIQRLRRTRLRSAVEQFRLTGLEARFNSFNELFNRRMRDVETSKSAQRGTDSALPALDPAHGIVVGGHASPQAVTLLYAALYPDDTPNKPELTSFRSFLEAQTEKIRQQTGCAEVRFRIANESGRPKLKAKPIRKEGKTP